MLFYPASPPQNCLRLAGFVLVQLFVPGVTAFSDRGTDWNQLSIFSDFHVGIIYEVLTLSELSILPLSSEGQFLNPQLT